MGQGRLAETVADCHQAISRDPGYAKAYLRRARALAVRRKRKEEMSPEMGGEIAEGGAICGCANSLYAISFNCTDSTHLLPRVPNRLLPALGTSDTTCPRYPPQGTRHRSLLSSKE
jgi:hypothetical protein